MALRRRFLEKVHYAVVIFNAFFRFDHLIYNYNYCSITSLTTFLLGLFLTLSLFINFFFIFLRKLQIYNRYNNILLTNSLLLSFNFSRISLPLTVDEVCIWMRWIDELTTDGKLIKEDIFKLPEKQHFRALCTLFCRSARFLC